MPGSFVLRAAGLMAVFCAAYACLREFEGDAVGPLESYLRFVAQASGLAVGPWDDQVVVAQRVIRGRFALEVAPSCSALDVQALAAAAVLAFPAPWKQRLVGLACCVSALTVVNVLRIASLYAVGVYAPADFDVVHGSLSPLVLLLSALGLFGAWRRWLQPATHAGTAA